MKTQKNKESKKNLYSKVIVVLCIASIWVYVIAGFLVQIHTGIEISNTLTTCFFTFFGVELLSLAGIKTAKTKNIKYDGTSMQENIESIENEDGDSDI